MHSQNQDNCSSLTLANVLIVEDEDKTMKIGDGNFLLQACIYFFATSRTGSSTHRKFNLFRSLR